MSSNYHWTSAEDIEDDLNSISDFYDSSALGNGASSYRHASVQRAPNEHVRKARSKPSIYDDDDDHFYTKASDNIPRCKPGRGYSLLKNNVCTKPGTTSFLRQQIQTAQEIREVCAYGFSNDLIENSLGTKQVKSRPSSTPAIDVADKEPMSDVSIGEQSSLFMAPSPVLSQLSNEVVPPPIYDILKSGRGKKKGGLKPRVDQPVNTVRPVVAPLDINSTIDFPELPK